jgi:hypothetical protein
MDFIFNNAFYLIIAAVFIGRLVVRFSAKSRQGEKKAPPRPSPFFQTEEIKEEVEEDSRSSYSQTRGSSDYLKELVLREAAQEAARQNPVPARPAPARPAPPPKKESLPRETTAFSSSQRLSALGRLPPLKRAVILAEILGSPKGM